MTQELFPTLRLDESLLRAVIAGTMEGLMMTGVEPPPVGASRLFTATRAISVIVGLVGKSNGSVTLNMSERGMLYLASKLNGDELTDLDEEAFDAIGEIGNMIAGRIKEELADNEEYSVSHISVPSVILGANYDVYYSRGIISVTVEFELVDMPLTSHEDRFFSVTTSLLRNLAWQS